MCYEGSIFEINEKYYPISGYKALNLAIGNHFDSIGIRRCLLS